ncbi:Dipeptidyl aminopeptidase/acylaminoacyl peptidase [Halobiforma haloterrestris]|uniref:Dipeptidyl aminopeptidase/acylaminoacyl peptidase n=1 Tax=Natronobacterium haloterrestre TaxID=148448 RepID=A0A1I1ID47_NATHA|nr:prolyl oligopeptidase family serine peptidase [Halobiforma haloterrestris]SFC34217.1 Dipeptidyl aminopeptidase/acylaminoacyl peptidase [Halobiforma haloterrestris]
MVDSVDDPLEELANLPTVAHPVVSPDGDEVAVYYDITGRNELHVIDAETGDLEQWSDGEVPRNARWYLKWDPDGDRVYFHRDEGGDEQNDIFAISRDGDVETVLEMDGQVTLHDVSEDGEALLVGSNRDGQMNVYRHDLADGETTKLTDYERAVWGSSFSPSGDRIAYSTNETDDFDNRDVYVANADGSDPGNLEIGDVGAESMPVDWGPDGDRLLVSDNTPDLGRVGVYDLADDEAVWFGGDEYEETPITFLPDGERVLALRTRDAVTVPVVYDLESGEGRELDVPEGVTSFGRIGPNDVCLDDDRLLLVHTTPTKRPELLVYDLADDGYETLLEAEYGPFDRDDFADAEYFTVDSDGVPETPAEAVDHDPSEELEIGCLLYDSGERPSPPSERSSDEDRDRSGRSPLVVMPHGGPRGRDDKSFNLYVQVLAAQGFSVLQVNYRGSTGRGREFVERLIEDWGGAEQGDVATAVEHVLETRDWVDEDRVAVFGGSYGGYSAYWQLVQYPELYDAGIAWIGLTDLEEQYETTMPHYRVELMEKYLGTPEENPDLYEERSPITHAENLSAPLLLVHGVNDSRVPVSQARLFRDRLEELGYEGGEDGDFEYEELGEEGHASTDQEQKLRTFRLLSDFLERRVGGEVVAVDADDD